MNPNIYTIVPDYTKTHLKVLQYNIDNAVREEKYEHTKWMNRKDRVVKLINSIDADIVCLQELRKLDGAISINQFLAAFEKYDFKVEYRNASKYSFGNAILYKPDKVYPVQTVKKWLSTDVKNPNDIPKGFGYIVLGVQFMPVNDEKIIFNAKPFWVFTTHLGLDEQLKADSCNQLNEIITDLIGQSQQPFILTGDFNFFPDKDGAKQRTVLTDGPLRMQDLGKESITSQLRVKLEGTFIGYEHDDFKADISSFDKIISRLDHIFASSDVEQKGPVILDTRTMLEVETDPSKELTDRNLPSDHLPLLVEIAI